MPGTNADVRGLGGFVWSIAEILRGDFKQSEYGKVILPFIVLRRLDCLLNASKRDVLEAAKGLSAAVDDPTRDMAQVDRTDVAFAQRILKFQANEKLVTNDFLAQLMMSASFQHSLRLFASGSTADGIKSERLAHLFGLAPPMEEQLEIVAFIERQIDRARNIVISVERSIDLLREFRSALITAVVTGQIDVSTWGKQGTADHRLDRIEETSSP